MKIWPQMIQQSEEWFRARKGRVTASNADRILTPTGKDSSQWDSYAIELTAECIRPDELPSFTGNHHTDRGNDLEPEAREIFTKTTGLEVKEIGFVTNEIRYKGVVGCSPDGLIYRDGKIVAGLELKCPMAKNHAAYLVEGGVPKLYRPQVQFSMAVCDVPWYFMSYCRGMAPHIVLCDPDSDTEKMADAIDRFVIYYGSRRKEIMPMLLGKEAT
jgi:putative phage-type endonuclease